MRLLSHSNTELVVKVRYFAPPDSELSELKENKMREGGEVREDQAGERLLCWFGLRSELTVTYPGLPLINLQYKLWSAAPSRLNKLGSLF